MNRLALQLLKKWGGIDVDQLQADLSRMQEEKDQLSARLNQTVNSLENRQKELARLQEELESLKNKQQKQETLDAGNREIQ